MKTKHRGKVIRALLAGLALAALVVVGVVYAATVVVDSFDAGTQTLTVDSSDTSDSSSVSGGSDVLGTYRDSVLNWDSGSTPINLTVDTGTPGSNELSYSAGAGTDGSATITWDGDNDASTLDHTGLNNADLVDSSPANDGIFIKIVRVDPHEATLTLTGYENSTNYEDQSITFGGGAAISRLDIFFPFNDFTVQAGTGADWSSLGALVLDIGGQADLDLTIDYMDARDGDNMREYGDLPSDYSDISAYHENPQGLTLGYNLDVESSNNASSDTQGDDDSDTDDEDGVTPNYFPPGNWYANVIVNGCSGTCYLNGWIDWNDNNDFADTGEHFISDQSGSNSTLSNLYFLDIDSYGTGAGYYHLRFRVCDASGECDDPGENATNGEIEDYRWYLGPNAVQLSAFTATWQDDAVEVVWETAMEIDTAGFNVWRSTAEDGDYVQVNDALIPTQSPGGTWGGSYALVDKDVTPDTPYFYKLEELETGGVHNWYGPTATQQETGGGTGPTALTLSTFTAEDALPAWGLLILGAGVVAVGIARRRRRS